MLYESAKRNVITDLSGRKLHGESTLPLHSAIVVGFPVI